MKVLIKDKIVESFKFPLTEALSFSILVWTIWGFAEAFYWQKLSPMFDKDSALLSPYIFITSFFLYLVIAAVVAVLVYSLVKWVLFTMSKDEDQIFRSATLAGILGIFFLAVLYHFAQIYLSNTALSPAARFGITGLIIVIIVFATIILCRTASRIGFRLRRSGTLMFSILAISVVLSFVRFPMFSSDQEKYANMETLDLRMSIRRLMAYQYLSPRPQKEGVGQMLQDDPNYMASYISFP